MAYGIGFDSLRAYCGVGCRGAGGGEIVRKVVCWQELGMASGVAAYGGETWWGLVERVLDCWGAVSAALSFAIGWR